MTADRSYDIVPLRTEDATALAQLHRRVMGEPDGWSDSGLLRLLTAAAARGLEAICAGEICGYVLTFAAADEAEILALCVAPEHQRQGMAGALLRRLMADLAATEVVQLHLEVRVSNWAARELYRRSGFVETGRRKGYYHSADSSLAEDGIMMAVRLAGRPATGD